MPNRKLLKMQCWDPVETIELASRYNAIIDEAGHQKIIYASQTILQKRLYNFSY